MIIPPNAATPAAIPSFQPPGAAGTGASGSSGASGGADIGEMLGSALEGVSGSLAEADQMAQQVATGEITDLSQLTAASAKAELGIQLTVAFRDRAVGSFQQIMQMQV